MRPLLLAATAVLIGTLGGGAADAAQGCGPGFHRGFYGYCRPNAYGYGGPVYRPGFYHYGYHWHHWWHRW